ncbi:MAG TPA: response regulator [Fimbriimonadaceae bacterium]|nr:response regulator [Fimbriimonadaceae bacterium]
MSDAHEPQSTILWVEDNMDEEVLVLRAIRQASLACQVIVAHSVKEALDYLLARNAFHGHYPGIPDVIVTNLRIGAQSGEDLIVEVRSRKELRLIPVVVLTGGASPAKIDELYRRGANSFIEKPTTSAEFSVLVANLARYWTHFNRSVSRPKRTRNFPYAL